MKDAPRKFKLTRTWKMGHHIIDPSCGGYLLSCTRCGRYAMGAESALLGGCRYTEDIYEEILDADKCNPEQEGPSLDV